MGMKWFEMGLNGFSQDPVQAPMSLSCCSAFEWLSPLGLGSGMRCEESNSTGTEQLRLHLTTFALLLCHKEKNSKNALFIDESNGLTRSSVYVQRFAIKI